MSEKMNGLKLSMGPATIEYAKPHVPSEIQADTLFTFMRQLDFLLPIIRNAMISPRYCEEDISYLSIDINKKCVGREGHIRKVPISKFDITL